MHRSFRKWDRELEGRLRGNRPEPSDDLVDRLVTTLESEAMPLRSGARLRYSLAFGLSLALIVVFASFGGISYAQSTISQVAVSAAKSVKTLAKQEKANRPTTGLKDSGMYLASIGTYEEGTWICHYDGTGPLNNPSNWDVIFLDSPATHAEHLGHPNDHGPYATEPTKNECTT